MRYLIISLLAATLFTAACRPSSHRASTPTASTYGDSFAYCAAVATVDQPVNDARWRGDSVPQQVIDGLRRAQVIPDSGSAVPPGITWRCAGGKLLGCYVGANLPCGKANTSMEPTVQMALFCQEQPNQALPAVVTGHDTIYAWHCRGDAAAIERQVWHADARGFVAELWHEIRP